MCIYFFSGFVVLFLCRAANLCSESVVNLLSSACSRVIKQNGFISLTDRNLLQLTSDECSRLNREISFNEPA